MLENKRGGIVKLLAAGLPAAAEVQQGHFGFVR
jgi:hypothetical protein